MKPLTWPRDILERFPLAKNAAKLLPFFELKSKRI